LNLGAEQVPRVRALDGLRGLAVAAVMCFHARVLGMRGGFLGVSAFFTLSGFLITSLLLAEHDRSGRIRLRNFWARRARRLLPAALLALAGIVAFGATIATADQQRALRGDVLSALGYVANWHFLAVGRSYSQLFSAPSPVLHFWSLAIEEQFYVVFPLLVALILRAGRGRRSIFAAALVAGIGGSVFLGTMLATQAAGSRVYYGTDTRAAELLVGALLAVVLFRRRPDRRRTSASPLVTAVGVLALGTMFFWWMTVDQTDVWLAKGGFALHACLTATVIAVVLRPGPLASAVSVAPLAALGRISYGVYLFHWPIFLWLTPERTRLATAPLFGVRVALTLALAIASFHLLEQPIRTGVRLRGAWPRVGVPAAFAALFAGLFVVTASPPAPAVVLHALGNGPVESRFAATSSARPSAVRAAIRSPAAPMAAVASAPSAPLPVVMHRPVIGNRPLRILVVGDSVGITFGRGIELWARQHGGVVVYNAGRMWCSLGRLLPRMMFGEGGETPSAGCSDWAQRWTRIESWFDPDVTFVMYTVWEGLARKLPGHTSFSAPGDPELDQWQLSEYQAAADVLASRGAPTVWFTIPCESHTTQQPRPIMFVNRRTLPRLAASRPTVHVVDLDHELCRDGQALSAYAGVVDPRPDGLHFSDAGALAVANWVMPIALGQAPAPPVPSLPAFTQTTTRLLAQSVQAR
jgi:peptidoglycan/LPS O-acetylase OafA/YrhL